MKLDFKRYFMSVLFAIVPVLILLNSIYIEIDYITIILTLLVILILIFIFNLKNKYVKIGVIVVAIILFIFTNNPENIYNGAKEFISNYNLAMVRYKNVEEYNAELIKTEYLSCLLRVYIEIMIPCLFVVYKNKFWKVIYLDITLPFLCLCLAIGKVPSTLEVYLLALLYVNIIVDNSEKKNTMELSDNASRIIKSIYINVILIMIFVVMAFVNKVKPYERSEKFDEYKAEINDFINGNKSLAQVLDEMFDFSFIFSGGKGHGGMSDGKLGMVDEIEFSGEEIMGVSFSEDYSLDNATPLYIKYFVGTDYTGDSWLNSDDEINKKVEYIAEKYDTDMTDIDEMLTDFMDYSYEYIIGKTDYSEYEKVNLKIEVFDDNDNNSYWPYYSHTGLSSECDGQKKDFDEKYGTRSFTIYTPAYSLPTYYEWLDIVSYYGKFPGDSESFNDGDAALYTKTMMADEYYSEIAKEYYLEIPESFKEIAEELDESYICVGNSDMYKIHNVAPEIIGYSPYIEFVKDYLADRCVYTLNPGKLNEGEDFVTKFLMETNEGYCSHFASAATLIFRAMGIPARYVEGYVASMDDYDEKTDSIIVKDDSAHAWVEIFVKRLGWVPVDVTPSYYRDVIENNISGEEKKTTDSEKNTTDKSTTIIKETTTKETTTTAEKKTTDKEETTTVISGGEVTSNSGGQTGTHDNPIEIEEGKKYISAIVAAVIMIILMVIICMYIRLRAMKEQEKYRKLIASDKYDLIFKKFEYQLITVMKMKKLTINIFETTKEITDKLLKTDDNLEYESADSLAKAIIKYRFSNDAIGESEAKLIVNVVKKINRDIYNNSNFIVKIIMYYIKCLYLSKK